MLIYINRERGSWSRNITNSRLLNSLCHLIDQEFDFDFTQCNWLFPRLLEHNRLNEHRLSEGVQIAYTPYVQWDVWLHLTWPLCLILAFPQHWWFMVFFHFFFSFSPAFYTAYWERKWQNWRYLGKFTICWPSSDVISHCIWVWPSSHSDWFVMNKKYLGQAGKVLKLTNQTGMVPFLMMLNTGNHLQITDNGFQSTISDGLNWLSRLLQTPMCMKSLSATTTIMDIY